MHPVSFANIFFIHFKFILMKISNKTAIPLRVSKVNRFQFETRNFEFSEICLYCTKITNLKLYEIDNVEILV